MSLFEESAQVPLLIVTPGVGEKGGVANSPVDLYPTLTQQARMAANCTTTTPIRKN